MSENIIITHQITATKETINNGCADVMRMRAANHMMCRSAASANHRRAAASNDYKRTTTTVRTLQIMGCPRRRTYRRGSRTDRISFFPLPL